MVLMTEDDETLVVQLNREVVKLDNFQLTFGDVLKAQQKAKRSNVKGEDERKQHTILWLVEQLFKKNGVDPDIDWLINIPIDEMRHVLEKMNEVNDNLEK